MLSQRSPVALSTVAKSMVSVSVIDIAVAVPAKIIREHGSDAAIYDVGPMFAIDGN
ncbi:hypothetical protein GCM10010520_59870 [Rhizobium viscosum]